MIYKYVYYVYSVTSMERAEMPESTKYRPANRTFPPLCRG